MGTMKVGKEDEKSLRPLFPRVHVNDTEKGGPRAPPRNKMALYEQLSIPLNKFSSTTRPPHKPSSVVSPASSIQGGTNERIPHSLFYQPNSIPSLSADKPCSRLSDGKSSKTRGLEFERYAGLVDYKTSRPAGSGAERNAFNVHDFKSGANSFKAKYDDDNDDFRVPTFAQSEVAPHSKYAPLVELIKPVSFGATNVQNSTTLDSSIHVLSSSSKPIHEAIASGKLSRKRERIHAEQEFSENNSSKEHGEEFRNNPEAGEMLADPSKILSSPSDRGAETNIKFLDEMGHHSARMGNEPSHDGIPIDRGTETNIKFYDETGHHSARIGNEPSHDGFVENKNACKMPHRSCSGASFGYSQRSCDDEANGSGDLKDTEQSGEVSEASIIDSISVFDISPDDVVGVIGPKQFWKARRAIVNQQRVFAIQVFELHRLIKVQKLFASSPHLLMDNFDIITIHPKETTKSLPLASSLKYQQKVQQRDHSTEKPAQNADSLLEKTVSPPLQVQEKDHKKELSQLPPIPTAPDNRQNPWCFQPFPNQWLIPVMSPSEGLIYKPYAGPCPPPGFMAPLYGGCGPLNMPSVPGDFVNSSYVFPSSHQQENHILPGAPPIGPNYFPAPYGGVPMVNPVISASAVEQVSPLTHVRSNGRSVQCSQSSCNVLITKSKALSGYPPKNKSSSKDNELQASTASSPSDKARREARDLLPVFSIPPAAEGSCQPSQSSGKENQTHVIKVTPHNGRSATESAARIFRSIQRERRQLDL